jgi:hypothetical protein
VKLGRAVIWMLALLATPVVAQEVPRYTRSNANLREAPAASAAVVAVLPQGTQVAAACSNDWCAVSTRGGDRGYVAGRLLGNSPPATPRVSDVQIRRALIRESINSYYGSCPCPYNADRAGRSCGRRSAYSRPGGASPLCYESDITADMVREYRARLAAP